tara:strand:+ start:764 stop:1153 length:390 start_codon:yes stop_codon:yes gene_type:complete
MSAIFPTGRPWQVKHDYDLEGSTTIIGNVDGEIIDGTTHNSFDFVCSTLDEMDDSQSRSIAVANAKFIVRAVNGHDAKRRLLRAFIEWSERVDQDADCEYLNGKGWEDFDALISTAMGILAGDSVGGAA